MKTVKELSALTGISVRTLHYYDEIGLLHPTEKSKAGYRFYDDQALERLQQILFFREFDIPLKEIMAVMESPALDRNALLQMQRTMLEAKKARIERLIASIDDILKGENKMDFAIFNQSDLALLCQSTIDHMPDFMRQCIVQEFGGIEAWKKHYIERASREDMQKGYQKLVEWYGDKESAIRATTNPPSQEVVIACENRVHTLLQKLFARREAPLDSFDTKSLIGEYGFVMKQFSQVKHEKGLMLSIASSYREERTKAGIEQKYGEGAGEYFAQAIETFYQHTPSPREADSQS